MTNKVLVLGLDGATFDLIKPWVEEGKLPTFKLLMEKGAYGELRSTVPPATCPAWPAFYTGKNPGKFGVYYFRNFKPNSYDTVFHSYRSVKAEALWDILSEYGLKSAVTNVPVTYPAKEINGIMVSGSAVDPNKSVYPVEFKAELAKDYVYSMPPVHSVGRDKYIELNFKSMQQQFELIDKFLAEDYDFVCSVMRSTDFFAHRFWQAMEDNDEKYGSVLYESYKKADDYLAELVKREGVNIIIMSDHGNTSLQKTFFINDWLIKEGYLKLKKELSSSASSLKKAGINKDSVYRTLKKLRLDWLTRLVPRNIKAKVPIPDALAQNIDSANIDWSQTKVIAKYAGDLYVNKKSSKPEGIVSDEEASELLEEIEQKLKNLHDEERKIDVIVHRNDIYEGNYKALAPDMVILMEKGSYRVASSVGNNKLFVSGASPNSTSNHTMEGIFFAYGPDIKSGKINGAAIIDITPTVLSLLGLSVPGEMDGKVLEGIFDEKFAQSPGEAEAKESSDIEQLREAGEQSQKEDKKDNEEGFAEDEEAIVKERLESLGYFD